MGGEPTLHPNIIDIFKYAWDKNLGINLITNGTRFADEKFCTEFKKVGFGAGSAIFSMHASSQADSYVITRNKMYFKLF